MWRNRLLRSRRAKRSWSPSVNRAPSFASHSSSRASNPSGSRLQARASRQLRPLLLSLKPPQLPQDLLRPAPHGPKPRTPEPRPPAPRPATPSHRPGTGPNPRPPETAPPPSERRPADASGPPPTPPTIPAGDSATAPASDIDDSNPPPKPQDDRMGSPLLQGSPTRRTRLHLDFHRLPDGLLGRPPPPRTTARYRLIPGKGRRRTPTPPHLGFQDSDPLPGLLQLRPEPLPFSQEPPTIRTSGLRGHRPLYNLSRDAKQVRCCQRSQPPLKIALISQK
jgi:hypothetical protein